MSANDTVGKTLLVAFLLCIACSVLVSASVVMLKDKQQENKELDRKRNILAAAGLLEPGKNVETLFQSVEVKVVDFKTGEYVEMADPQNYDQRKAAKDPKQNMRLQAGEDIAGIKRRAPYGTVYLAKNSSGAVERIILPIHGYGLWSTLYGFLALEKDAETVAGLGFYEHAETPGLGGEVDNPQWKAQWLGKKIYDGSGNPAISMFKGQVTSATPDAEHKFDALAGATLTSRGVENLVNFWTGELGFGPYLKKLKSSAELNSDLTVTTPGIVAE